MKNLLVIDSSARRTDHVIAGYNSISKQLGALFIDEWMKKSHQDTIVYRDVGAMPPEFISQDWIAAVFTPEAQRSVAQHQLLALSDTLIAEVEAADLIIMTAPMYNYGMPAALKAWFDQVIRINKTFTFDLNRGDTPLEPMFQGKTLVLLSSAGEFGFEPGGIKAHMNHLGTHIEVLSKYLGVNSFYEIRSEYQEFGDARHEQSLADAKAAAIALAGQLRDQSSVLVPSPA
ncbi:FMN-dependent NADH-azoreductase [Photobacterium atrarenae]|uniref:FMN dependent NADH:quinone oxidoreductase n=1 Tax=Photobacterium atrarenae TaxID=865757 RepID=A0ABY5GLP6_9GAMM|nr:NAD(P)H-dependent oxidoreductase [Photobacterium atrarenae]UTV30248.1 NAD(P)H-dependent oxidoreductase [Photobacterium atrarenae]